MKPDPICLLDEAGPWGVWVTALGVRIRRTPGDIDPLNNVPAKRARSRAKKGPL